MSEHPAAAAGEAGFDDELLREIALLGELIDLANHTEDRVSPVALDALLLAS
jgi:hypothetical protein